MAPTVGAALARTPSALTGTSPMDGGEVNIISGAAFAVQKAAP